MSDHIYIITTRQNKHQGLFKVGRHSGGYDKLIKRYITALPNIEVILFEVCPCADIVECNIKAQVEQYRVKNIHGILSEWVNMPIHKLKSIVNKEIVKYNNKNAFNMKFPNMQIHPLLGLLDFLS